MDDLGFITDAGLRRTLVDSIEYMYALYSQSKSGGENNLYLEETYRVIVLYAVSAIEALLLYLYKVRGEAIQCIEYKYLQPLPASFSHSDKKGCPVVVAVQVKVEKKEHQLGVYELVEFCKEKKLLSPKLAEDILKMNDVRNTFHFSKPRSKPCDVKIAEHALQLLVQVIARTEKSVVVGK
jgi:hypothetical protein